MSEDEKALCWCVVMMGAAVAVAYSLVWVMG